MPAQRRFKPGSIGQYFDGPRWDGKLTEVHCSVCAHCQTPTEFPSMRQMMDFVDICRGCMKLICPKCASGPCRPYEKEAERLEQEEMLRRKIHMQAWRCY